MTLYAIKQSNGKLEAAGPTFDSAPYGWPVQKGSPLAQSLLPSGYFDPRRRVIISVTTNGEQTVLMDGVITKQDVTPGAMPGQSTLTVTGLDLTALMDFMFRDIVEGMVVEFEDDAPNPTKGPRAATVRVLMDGRV